MYKVLLAAAAAVAAAYANSEYQKNQLGKELWAKATDQPKVTDVVGNSKN